MPQPRKVSITGSATDQPSSPRPALPVEAEASLRKILSEQIAGAQYDIDNQIGALRHAGQDSAITQAQGQLQILGRLQRKLESASPADMAALRAEITAIVAATQLSAPQSLAGAPRADEALQAASDAARHQVAEFEHDFYEKKIFDPYLHFDSEADEKAYREREAARRKAIDDAMAKHTPQGDLEASKLEHAQLVDAGSHGADKSPDYAPMMSDNSVKTQELENQMQSANTKATPTPAADPLAALRAAGVSLADQDQTGHGIQQRAAQATTAQVSL